MLLVFLFATTLGYSQITVNNTPAASSQSVAELVFGQMLEISRFTYAANSEMPVNGDSEFKILKKKCGLT